MEIHLKMLTPLWTGGTDGTMDRIHETGISGSLRWWYEAIVRGLGGWACDPSKHECNFDAEKYRKSKHADERQRLRDAGLCDVCQVFGATGWRRRFRLEIGQDNTKAIWSPPDRMLNIRPPDRNRGWFLPPGWMGTLTLRLDGDDETLSLLAALFLFLEQWGSIGSKPQLGYGVFEIKNHDEVRDWATGNGDKPGREWKILGNERPGDKRPDLRRFGFLRYRFRPARPGWWTRVPGIERVASQVQSLVSKYGVVPATPALKNEWRFHRWQGSRREDEREIFGALRPKRQRSKVSASWAYRAGQDWEVRGWVWLSSKRWADETWRVLTERDGWEKSLRVQGRLETRRITTGEQVKSLLEATR